MRNTRRLRSKYIALPCLAALILSAFLSCGNRPIGWGVVLWSEEESAYATGAIVPVFFDSDLNDVYGISASGDKPDTEVERWRLDYHKRQADAEQASAEFARFELLYARSKANVDGLLIREEPDHQAQWVYRMRERELVKVIGRREELATVGDHEGYWYVVLTSDGTTGYSFDYNLEIGTLDEFAAIDEAASKDPLLAAFLNSVFRPDYFANMIRTGRIDLARFSPRVGIFPDPENNKIVLQMQKFTEEFEYTDIEKIGENRYRFTGTSLIVLMRSETTALAQYVHDDKEWSVWFVQITEDIEELIVREEERRLELYDALRERGTVLTSTAYGEITLEPNQLFQWIDFDRLVPDSIPRGSPSTGIVDFPLFMGRSLATQYEGTISFQFDSMGSEDYLHFLYKYTDTGVQFTLVPDEDIEDFFVEELRSPPFIIFFSLEGDG